MLSNEPDKNQNRTPWVIGALALVLIGFATYLNYGNEWFHHAAAADISSTATPK